MLTILSKKENWAQIIKNGRSVFLSTMTLKWQPNHLKYNRYGIMVSLKVDKRAVVRHKITRQLKYFFLHSQNKIKPGFDMVILTREQIKILDYQQLKEQLQQLLIKANLFC